MGGYGFYVWGSYAAVLAAVAIEVLLLRSRRLRALSDMKLNLAQRAGVAQAGVAR